MAGAEPLHARRCTRMTAAGAVPLLYMRSRGCILKALHATVQVIDDTMGHTLVAASTLTPEVKASLGEEGSANIVSLCEGWCMGCGGWAAL